MLKNYFLIAVRNLLRNKTHALINLLGLSLAFLCSTLLFLNAANELSWDQFHPDKERIFKLYNYSINREGEEMGASMSLPVAPTVKSELPCAEAVSRLMWNGSEVEVGDKQLNLQVNLVDNDFFKVFLPPVLKGNSGAPLSDPGAVVITAYAAERLFGKEEAIGKRIRVKVTEEWKELVVSAVLADFPDNTSVKYDLLARSELRADYAEQKNNWNQQNHEVFLKLRAGVTQQDAEKQLADLLERHQPVDTSFLKDRGYRRDANGHFHSLRLLPVTESHFNREVGAHNAANSKTYIYSLLLICFFILAIACFNFINLNVAMVFTRTREVGVRKCLGAARHQIFFQMCGESFLLSAVALTVGFIAAIVLVPHFNQIFRAGLKLSFFFRPGTITMLLFSLLFISLIAGGYPALLISRFPVSGVLRGNASIKKPGLLRNSLIVLQFTAASVLMACTLIAYKQFQYVRTLPLGYNKDALVSLPVAGADGREVARELRNQLRGQPSVINVSSSDINLGLGKDGGTSKMVSGFGYKDHNILTNWMAVDQDFLRTLNVCVVKGRDFKTSGFTEREDAVVVTESAAKQFGAENPVGLTFKPDSARPGYTIIGVIPDFHLYSLHEKSEPLTLCLSPQSPLRYVFIKTHGNPVAAIKLIEDAWKKILPGVEFKGSFVDENTDRWYQKEKRLSTLLGISSLAAVILSCLGLFALALLMIRQRVKEIGVRKVLGASVFSLNRLLAKDFLKLVLIGVTISVPVSWWAMNNWLQDFPYRIAVSWSFFAAVALVAAGLALLTVSFHTLRAANRNPVDSLRSE